MSKVCLENHNGNDGGWSNKAKVSSRCSAFQVRPWTTAQIGAPTCDLFDALLWLEE